MANKILNYLLLVALTISIMVNGYGIIQNYKNLDKEVLEIESIGFKQTNKEVMEHLEVYEIEGDMTIAFGGVMGDIAIPTSEIGLLVRPGDILKVVWTRENYDHGNWNIRESISYVSHYENY